MFTQALKRWKLRRHVKEGLQVAEDCRPMGFPNFGSEPYLASFGPSTVVASRAVVTRDVPANTVAGGVLARILMTLPEYAEKCLANLPDYGRAAYRQDTVAELLRTHPRLW